MNLLQDLAGVALEVLFGKLIYLTTLTFSF